MRDGGDVEDGMRLAPWNSSISNFMARMAGYSTGRGQRVITGVITERAFVAERLGRVNVTFKDEVGVGQNAYTTCSNSFSGTCDCK